MFLMHRARSRAEHSPDSHAYSLMGKARGMYGIAFYWQRTEMVQRVNPAAVSTDIGV